MKTSTSLGSYIKCRNAVYCVLRIYIYQRHVYLSCVCKVHIFYMSAMPQTTAMLYSVVCITYTWTVSRFLLNSRRLETCLHSQALCAHCWSADFKTRHHGFDVLPASRDSKGIMQTLRDALCVGQRALNPRTCTGIVVATERPTWRLQRGCLGELVCNDQVVKSHASLDDDGIPTNRQSKGFLQDSPLVHQHPERTLNCHSQRTMVEGEDAFVGAHVANVGSQYR